MNERTDFPLFSTVDAGAGGADARRLVRSARFAALATLDAGDGTPFASLVSLATDAAGAPLMLLSNLARHTRNLARTRAASLLVHAAVAQGDPLTDMRVTLQGEITGTENPADRERFLAWQPDSSGYADFADFNFYRLDIRMVHVVAGFGRIQSSSGEDYLEQTVVSAAALAQSRATLEHDHQSKLCTVWSRTGAGSDRPTGEVHLVALDADGAILSDGQSVRRITFAQGLDNPNDLQAALLSLAGPA